MTNPTKEITEHLNLLRDFPVGDLGKANVEDLWKQLLSYRSNAPNELTEAKARRAQAEATREQAVLDAVRNTQAVCERIRASAERDLQDAKAVKEEMLRLKQRAEEELRQAQAMREQSEQEVQRILGEAKGAGQDIVSQARLAAQKEATEYRQAVLIEIKHVLTRAESMSSAIAEELETQRILSSVARISANTDQLLAQAIAPHLDGVHSEVSSLSQPVRPQEQVSPAQPAGPVNRSYALGSSLQEALQSLMGSIETAERSEFQRGSLGDGQASEATLDKGLQP